MKKYFSVALMCLVSLFFFSACNNDEPENKENVNYDQMIGSWKLTSYSVIWKNVSDDQIEKSLNYQDGYLIIEKKKFEDVDAYFYKENFAREDRQEYYGMIEIDTERNFIYLRGEDGFPRDDAEIYDFTVSFPADGKMQWKYSWKGDHTPSGVSHICQRDVIAVFVKQ